MSELLFMRARASAKPTRTRPRVRASFFAKEAHLVTTFQRTAPTLRWNGFIFIKEVASANGIADLIAVRLRRDWRLQSRFQSIPPQWAYTYFLLPYRKSFSAETVERLAGVSAAHARTLLRAFQEHGLAYKGNSGWVKAFQPRPIAAEVVAFEAKLSKWRSALYQASRHAAYAHRTWVVLDERYASSASRELATFRSKNVGLASVRRDGTIREYFRPRSREPFDPIALWRINNELLRRLSRVTSSRTPRS